MEAEWKHTITGGISAELFTKRRRSVNCRSRDGYVASEVSDCDRTWVYNSLEALQSHGVSRGRDTVMVHPVLYLKVSVQRCRVVNWKNSVMSQFSIQWLFTK